MIFLKMNNIKKVSNIFSYPVVPIKAFYAMVLVSFYRYEVLTHKDRIRLLLNLRFSVEFVDFRVSDSGKSSKYGAPGAPDWDTAVGGSYYRNGATTEAAESLQ
jgi:hypothetical protein